MLLRLLPTKVELWRCSLTREKFSMKLVSIMSSCSEGEEAPFYRTRLNIWMIVELPGFTLPTMVVS